jgi:hypothetical protein
MKKNNMIELKKQDAKKLHMTIVDVEAHKELYDKELSKTNSDPKLFKELLQSYIESVKIHKEVWKDILDKYVKGEDRAYYRDVYRYDIVKNVIFIPEGFTTQ